MTPAKINSGYVLLVDDIIDNIEMLNDMLLNEGFAVQHALDGEQALRMIDEHAPDLILLDIQMPSMDGYEVCRRIKANPETKDIPVIFLSALSETSDIVKGFDAGGVDYVSKPFKYREVMARVQSQLEVSRQRREIEWLRERDRQQFESLAKIKNNFMYGTAHDLKNPLTGLLLYTQMLQSSPPDDPEDLQRIAEGIETSARKMQRLITDIIDLAQMQVGDQLNRIELPLEPIIEAALRTAVVLADEKDVELHLHLPDHPTRYPVAANYFERMLDNLISNAIKYTPAGGSVTVSLERFENRYEICVSDTGLGIPAEDIPHLFEAFYRVKTTEHRKASGSGLGLSIVAAIVEEHDGEISVESELGQGSTFIIRLPL